MSPLNPRVSVAMCSFNGERFLRRQLESIAGQERLPDELVVCDDGSSDASVEILREFAGRARFPVHIVSNERNLGSTKNFEKAISLCTGDFIALCDQDDQWLPHKLSRLSEVLAKDESMGGVFSDADLVDADGTPIGKRLWEVHKFGFASSSHFNRMAAIMLLLKHDVVTGATLMFRASMRNVMMPIPDYWIHDGWIAWVLALYSRLTFVSEPLLRYRIHGGQQLGVGHFSQQRNSDLEEQGLTRLVAQFEALRGRWTAYPGDDFDDCLVLLENKIAFLQRRNNLPGNTVRRAFAVLSSIRSYQQYARGLSSMRGDLVLHPSRA
jgi:glycosyltransferase involved in cell wall biosynthesis